MVEFRALSSPRAGPATGIRLVLSALARGCREIVRPDNREGAYLMNRVSNVRECPHRRRLLALVAAATLGFVHVAQGITYNSVATSGGSWTNTGIWNHTPAPPAPTFPANAADEFLVSIGDNVVLLNFSPVISSFSTSGSGQLDWQNGRSLTLNNGPITNNGFMNVNQNGNVAVFGTVDLSGDGIVSMTDPTSRIIPTIGGGRLRVIGTTILGRGVIGTGSFNLTNDGGLILANVAGQTLTLDPADDLTQLNDGVLRADDGATLRLAAGFFNNAFGKIEAVEGSLVDLNNADIFGGMLTADASSRLRALSQSVSRIESTTLTTGTHVEVQDRATLNLRGTVTNNGRVTMLSVPGFFTTLGVEGAVTLNGSGSIAIDSQASERIFGSGAGAALTQSAGHTIAGSGIIDNLLMNNRGLVNANRSGETLRLFLPAGESQNSGTMRASNGAVLRIDGVTSTQIDNGGGLIEAASGSRVELFRLTISGGELHSSSSGSFLIQQGQVHLNNLKHSAITQVNSTLHLNGVIDNGLGILNVATSGDILLDGDTTLSGLGDIVLAGNASIGKLGTPAAATLINQTNLIRGQGNVGDGQISVINHGVIEARDFGALTLQPSPAGSFTNTGTLKAAGSASLVLLSGVYSNSGLIQSDDATVDIRGVTIDQQGGGEIRAEAGSRVLVGSGAVVRKGTLATHASGGLGDPSSRILVSGSEPRFDDVTNRGLLLVQGGNAVANKMVNQGLIRIENDRTLTLENMLTLNSSAGGGRVEVNGEGGTLGSVLRIRDDVTIGGSGTIRLSGTTPGGVALASIFGTSTASPPVRPILTNMVRIEGEGRIGASPGGDLGLINLGTVAAQIVVAPLVGGEMPALDLNVLTVTNGGVLQAESGAMLRLSGATITNSTGSGDGVIRAHDAAVVQLSNITHIAGGVLDTAGSGVIRNVQLARLEVPLQNTGVFETGDSATTQVQVSTGGDELNNSGTIRVGGPGGFATVETFGAPVLTGGGIVELRATPFNQIIGDGLINLDNTIRGAGQIDRLQNRIGGRVVADGSGTLRLFDPGNNFGRMHAAGPGGIEVAFAMPPTSFINSGTIQVDAGSRLDIVGTLVNGGVLLNFGTATATFLNDAGGRLLGNGTLVGPVSNNNGVISPGLSIDAASLGTLQINGALNLNDGAFSWEIGEEILFAGGGLSADRINVTGHAALGGTLVVSFIDDAVALPGDTFTALTFGSRSGDVTVVNDTPYAGLMFNKVYDATSLTLDVDALDGDANLDARVNLQDFNILAANFGASGVNWLMADFTGDGLVNLADFNRLAANFGLSAGGPDVTAHDWAALAATVPEPSTSMLALLTATIPFMRGRFLRAR
jgi:hypothetical protein